jgi:hypothetical protein
MKNRKIVSKLKNQKNKNIRDENFKNKKLKIRVAIFHFSEFSNFIHFIFFICFQNHFNVIFT